MKETLELEGMAVDYPPKTVCVNGIHLPLNPVEGREGVFEVIIPKEPSIEEAYKIYLELVDKNNLRPELCKVQNDVNDNDAGNIYDTDGVLKRVFDPSKAIEISNDGVCWEDKQYLYIGWNDYRKAHVVYNLDGYVDFVYVRNKEPKFTKGQPVWFRSGGDWMFAHFDRMEGTIAYVQRQSGGTQAVARIRSFHDEQGNATCPPFND